MKKTTPSFRWIALLFLTFQSVAAGIWWIVLFLVPASRPFFKAPGAPDSTLMSLCLPDVLVFVGGGLLSAWGIAHCTHWARTVLAVHTGAGLYAGLSTLALSLMSGGGWLGFFCMLPSLVCLPLLLWRLQRETTT